MKQVLQLLPFILSLLSLQGHAQHIQLFRYNSPEGAKPAVRTSEGAMLDVSGYTTDFNERFFEAGGIPGLVKWLEKNRKKCKPVPPSFTYAPCVARPSKIVAIGLNYLKHIQESGASVPSEPVIFFKATTALCGPNDPLIIPKNSVKTDYEVELAIVIGKKASSIHEEDAPGYIAGYTIINDYSEREWQLEKPGLQWDKGKSADHFAPLGPYLVTPEEVGDPHNLNLWLKVNGEMRQNSNTGDMVYKVARLVSEVSKYMTLLPGDVIATGTPSGVGQGFKPPKFLKPGDVIELGIDKLGAQKQLAVSK
ncbi:MAG TPA: fumarylacetoacetate hydrolase family protein [Saprospiraceae bacterium]|nr:fumarylacetoacetate hydrolase family protein [Saprospiraceae bacterium]HNT21538.1 fumarylacetoacetate hydrolase family protein [Saprospiraceae bacterium]